MRKVLFIVLLAFLSSVFLSCAGWIKTKYPQNKNFITANGNGESQLLQNAIDEATLVARRNIAAQVESRIKGYQIRFVKETGMPEDADIMRQFADVIKQVISLELFGARTTEEKHRKKWFGETYQAVVTVQYPIGEANQALMNQLKRNRNLRTEFEKTKLFDEMEKEIKEYEQWKKEQGY